MTSNIYIIAGIISTVFFIVKFIEMRFVDKESKPLKYLLRDTLLVYFSVIAGSFIVDQLKPVMDDTVTKITTPVVFTDNPGF